MREKQQKYILNLIKLYNLETKTTNQEAKREVERSILATKKKIIRSFPAPN